MALACHVGVSARVTGRRVEQRALSNRTWKNPGTGSAKAAGGRVITANGAEKTGPGYYSTCSKAF
jgi:hypothetical protein